MQLNSYAEKLMSELQEKRDKLASTLVAEARSICGEQAIDRAKLDEICARLAQLAAQRELWTEADFPDPPPGELQHRYRVACEDDNGITLYMNVLRPGKKSPPHNHTTWACVAAVEGTEHNILYERTDDASVDGRATLQEASTIALGPGDSIALMPEDIHHIEVRGDEVIRHLHFYGRPLETLSERKSFDTGEGTYRIMDIGVKTIG
jgi:predicted metal-dependent enzyme (double-stranded beta helix superfamily)